MSESISDDITWSISSCETVYEKYRICDDVLSTSGVMVKVRSGICRILLLLPTSSRDGMGDSLCPMSLKFVYLDDGGGPGRFITGSIAVVAGDYLF